MRTGRSCSSQGSTSGLSLDWRHRGTRKLVRARRIPYVESGREHSQCRDCVRLSQCAPGDQVFVRHGRAARFYPCAKLDHSVDALACRPLSRWTSQELLSGTARRSSVSVRSSARTQGCNSVPLPPQLLLRPQLKDFGQDLARLASGDGIR